jgi:hypothetical protein
MAGKMLKTVPVALALLAAAGCGTAPQTEATHSPSPSPTVPAAPAYLATSLGGGLTGVSHATTLDPRQSMLIGPHSVVQLDMVGVMHSITENQAADLNFTGSNLQLPMRPAAGDEFVVAHVADTDVQPELASGDTQSAAKATVLVGSEERQIDGVLDPDYTLVISVPTGSPVHLRMNDGGRPQEIDLRTGKRTRSASPLYYPEHTASLDVPTFYLLPGGNKYDMVSSTGSTADLSPYHGKHWAAKGRAWLILWLPFYSSNDTYSSTTLTAHQLGLSISLPDGSYPSGSWSNSSAAPITTGSNVSQEGISGVFSVPSSLRSATLIIDPPMPFSTGGDSYSPPLHVKIHLKTGYITGS